MNERTIRCGSEDWVWCVTRWLAAAQPDLPPIVVVAARAERSLPVAIDGFQDDAGRPKAAKLAGLLIDSRVEAPEHTVASAAELEHLALEFHPAVAGVPISVAKISNTPRT
jgi:hypothetical protein